MGAHPPPAVLWTRARCSVRALRRGGRGLAGLLLALIGFSSLGPAPAAQTPLSAVRIAEGLTRPLYLTSPPGDDRLFIVQQGGEILILQDGVLLPTPFLDASAVISGGEDERGLLGLAFHPDYAENGKLYVYLTRLLDPPVGNPPLSESVVAEVQVSASNPNAIDPTSFRLLLTEPQPYNNHNGGCLQFGPLDGYLYIGLGDGGSAGDPGCRAQDLGNRLGKLLRVDVDGAPPFAVPPDNPFVGVPGRDEIWSYGWRNPWRFSFDRETGDLYVADVGQNDVEEVDFEPALTGGRNYGWKIMEGSTCFSDANCTTPEPCNQPAGTNPALVLPIDEYTHTGPFGAIPCSITGGYVYRGCAMPDLRGQYFYADLCTDDIWVIEYDGSTVISTQEISNTLNPPAGVIDSITSFGQDADGELYVVDGGGEIYKLVPAGALSGADCDGNGRVDSCEIAAAPVLDLSGDGVPDACQTLSADVEQFSVSGGGEQRLFLHAGSRRAGSFYRLGGSLSGTDPGTDLLGVNVPLNFDFYSTLPADTPPLLGNAGNLDGDGQASARFRAGPGQLPPVAVGLTAHHAYVLIEPGPSIALVSNPVRLELGP